MPEEGQRRDRPCACGKGRIHEIFLRGGWVSVHSVWDGGVDFGKLSYVPCCARCSDVQERIFQREIDRS